MFVDRRENLEGKSLKRPPSVVQNLKQMSICGLRRGNDEYLFTCDAMGGITGTVFYSDGDDRFEPSLTGLLGDDRLMGTGYHACGETHTTQVGDDFIEGWYVTGWDAITGEGELVTKVIIWRGPEGNNSIAQLIWIKILGKPQNHNNLLHNI